MNITIYIDCVDRWCKEAEASELISNGYISDNGQYITLSIKDSSMSSIHKAISNYING